MALVRYQLMCDEQASILILALIIGSAAEVQHGSDDVAFIRVRHTSHLTS